MSRRAAVQHGYAQSNRWLTAGSWESVVTQIHYPASPNGVAGEFLQLPGEEYVQVEVSSSEPGAVVLWSSHTDISEAISSFRDVLGAPSDDERAEHYLSWDHGRAPSDAYGATLEGYAEKDANAVRLFTSVYGGRTVSWRRPQVKMTGGVVLHAELAMIGREISIAQLGQLMIATGTKEVEAAVRDSGEPLRTMLGRAASTS